MGLISDSLPIWGWRYRSYNSICAVIALFAIALAIATGVTTEGKSNHGEKELFGAAVLVSMSQWTVIIAASWFELACKLGLC